MLISHHANSYQLIMFVFDFMIENPFVTVLITTEYGQYFLPVLLFLLLSYLSSRSNDLDACPLFFYLEIAMRSPERYVNGFRFTSPRFCFH